MELSQALKEQLNRLKEAIKIYQEQREELENLHKLRVESRRTLSLMSEFKESLVFFEIKKIIKLSNPIRDYDVMFGETIKNLPKRLYKRLEKIDIKCDLEKKKRGLEESLLEHLQKLSFSEDRFYEKKVSIKQKKSKSSDIFELFSAKLKKMDSNRLHKLRINVKKIRYTLETHSNQENKTIILLKAIQEYLGKVHDNDVCLSFLRYELKGNKKEIEKFKRYFEAKNKTLIKKSQNLIYKLKKEYQKSGLLLKKKDGD